MKNYAKNNWKIYSPKTIFTFGRHNGNTLEEVAQVDVRYILWCVKEIKTFLIEKDLFLSYQNKYPHLIDAYDRNLKQKTVIDFNSFSASNETIELLENRWDQYLDNYLVKSNVNNDEDMEDEADYYIEDNPYYDDNLDMDQQDPEFWDTF